MTDILAKIGDPRAVPDLMELLERKDEKIHRSYRHNALDCIEEITFCTMRTFGPSYRLASLTVPHANAIPDTQFSDLDKAVQLYRAWLAGEGKDPIQWLPLVLCHTSNFG